MDPKGLTRFMLPRRGHWNPGPCGKMQRLQLAVANHKGPRLNLSHAFKCNGPEAQASKIYPKLLYLFTKMKCIHLWSQKAEFAQKVKNVKNYDKTLKIQGNVHKSNVHGRHDALKFQEQSIVKASK